VKIFIGSIAGLFAAFLCIPSQLAYAGNETQNILINEDLQIPGAVLAPGKYVLSVADQLYDRMIVQITRQGRNERYLVLAVPSAAANNNKSGELVFFRRSSDGRAALRRWGGLEFVYPKPEAVKITADSGQNALAIDPVSDKLPAHLSQEDMKIVTLWAVSPIKVTAENRGVGVTAAKYASATDSSATMSSPLTRAAAPVQVSNVHGRRVVKKLPKTASNNYAYLLYGAVLLSVAGGIRGYRIRPGMAL
jgi:LPXTG-motif cell wall-anchored protein